MKTSNMGNLTPVTRAIIGMANQETLATVLSLIIDNTAVDANIVNEMLLGIYEEPKLATVYTDDQEVEYRLLGFNPFTFEVLAEYDKEIIRYHDSDAKAKDAELRGNEYAGFDKQSDNYQFPSVVKVIRRRNFSVKNWPCDE